jgi:hypothetical protein
MKLSATQKTLIQRAQQNAGKHAIECGSGRGAQGGRISYGTRDRDALHKLVAAGIVRITHQSSDNVYTGNGYSVRGAVISFELL